MENEVNQTKIQHYSWKDETKQLELQPFVPENIVTWIINYDTVPWRSINDKLNPQESIKNWSGSWNIHQWIYTIRSWWVHSITWVWFKPKKIRIFATASWMCNSEYNDWYFQCVYDYIAWSRWASWWRPWWIWYRIYVRTSWWSTQVTNITPTSDWFDIDVTAYTWNVFFTYICEW